MSKAISWSSKAPLIPTEEPSQWMIIERKSALMNINHKEKQSHLKVATGSSPVRVIKQKVENDEQDNACTAKKLKQDNAEAAVYSLIGPIGLVWDHQNWSCTYDSFFTIVYYVWTTNPHKWNKILKDLNPTAALFVNSYQKGYNKIYTGEHAQHAQNLIIAHLHDSAQDCFSCGEKGMVLAEVIHEMFKSNNGMEIWTTCLECNIPKQTISHEDI